VRDYIRSIKNTTTVVLTTHDMEEAEKLSDRICIIDKGKLLVAGTANEIIRTGGYEDLVEADVAGDIRNELIPFLDPELISGISISGSRISFNNKNPLAAIENILKTVREHNLKVNSLQLRRKSLEDIFISLTGRSIRE
jgi:ABC-2 type transport system ATP-binding protein